MASRRLALTLAVLCMLAIVAGTAVSILAHGAAVRAGASETRFLAFAPWITGALGALAAALAVAPALVLFRRPHSGAQDAAGQADLAARGRFVLEGSEHGLFDTRLKAAESQVHEEEARLEAIVRSAMDAIITVDSDQRIVLFNAAAEKMFGCTAADAIGELLERFIPERFRGGHRAHVERFGRTGETSRRMGVQMALWALRTDGTEFPIEASISQATVRGQRLLTVILRDVTERTAAEHEIRRSHQELRELSVAMAEVRELERTRIARELHDELGQALTALKMDVELLSATLPPGRADLIEQMTTMRELLDSTVATTRRISSDLRPLVLDHLGLEAAAQWLAQNFSQRSGLPCDLRVDPSCSALGEPYASALFRIMQESLTNVVRHARAKRVEVRLDRSGPEAVLSVRDDGVGMEQAARAKPRSFGLRGISERVLLLEGQVQIASAPGAGTTLLVRIPLRGHVGSAAA